MKEWIVKIVKIDQVRAETEDKAVEIAKDHLIYKGIDPTDFNFRAKEVKVV